MPSLYGSLKLERKRRELERGDLRGMRGGSRTNKSAGAHMLVSIRPVSMQGKDMTHKLFACT